MGMGKRAEKKSKKEKTKKSKDKSKKEKKDKSKKRKREETTQPKEELPTVPSPKKQRTASNHADKKQIKAYREANRITVHTFDHGDDRAPVLSFQECKEIFPETTTLIDTFCKGFTINTNSSSMLAYRSLRT